MGERLHTDAASAAGGLPRVEVRSIFVYDEVKIKMISNIKRDECDESSRAAVHDARGVGQA